MLRYSIYFADSEDVNYFEAGRGAAESIAKSIAKSKTTLGLIFLVSYIIIEVLK
jgi:hypothetical protein